MQRKTILFLSLIFVFSHLHSQNMADYCATPPYITTSVKPNVLIVLDNSGSMMYFAYNFNGSDVSVGFDPSRIYYGYFKSNMWYTYDNTRFVEAGSKSGPRPANSWDGNFLNWLTMRRVDIARKVVVGGKAVSRIPGSNQHELQGEQADGTNRGYQKMVTNAQNYTPYSGTRCFTFNYGSATVSQFKVGTSGGTCPSGVSGSDVYNVRVWVGEEPLGILQKVGNKVRWGLEFYNENQGGRIHTEIRDDVVSSMVTGIEGTRPSTWTPLGEALWTAIGYFGQIDVTGDTGPRYFNPNSQSYRVSSDADPYNYGTGGQPYYIWCAKAFVIMITDGEPTQDRNIPTSMRGYFPLYTDGTEYVPTWAGPNPPNYFWYGNNYGSHYIDDVALYGRVDLTNKKYRDLRSNLQGDQYITSYFVFASFGEASPDGRTLLKRAARNGGFEDMNGNFLPDLQMEYDKDGDGNPDNYYEAADGAELERSLISAINDILNRTSSGTAASVLSTSTRGAISILQAFFTPRYVTVDKEITWTGHLQFLWLDQRHNMREDTVEDDQLILNQDRIIQPYLDTQTNDVKVRYFSDNNFDGRADFPCINTATGFFDEIKAIWRAEELLLYRNPNDRKIYTFLDTNKNGRPDSGEFVEFLTFQSSQLAPYFRVNATNAENYIKYIRGEDVNICLDPPTCTTYGCRDRTMSGDVWKLGDIVHSTPRIVGNIPINSYHIDYMDATYQEFVKSPDPDNPTLYETRKNVVYFGANDGMLHCVNIGKIKEDKNPNNPALKAHLEGEDIGEELWAYIPYNLLPQVPWIGHPDYCHIYYVDGRTLVFDASINGPSGGAKTKNSWRTILIGTMRLGGKPISVNGDFGLGNETRTFRSAIFAMDVTDPENFSLLWEFTDPDLGFTTSFPTVVRFGDKSNNGDWYLVFGNGPENFSGRDQTKSPKLYVVDLRTGTLLRKIEIASNIKGYLGDLVAIDPEKDYQVDTIYVGTVEMKNNPPLVGRLLRIQTMESSNPNSWVVSTLVNPQLPITASPEVVFDERRNIWVLFGTGIFLSVEDKSITYPQSLFGVKDENWSGPGSGEVGLNQLFTMNLSDTNPANDYDVTAEVEDFTCYCNGVEVPEKIEKDANGQKIGCISPAEKVVTYVKNAKVGTTNWKEHLNTVTTQYKGWRLIIPSGERCITRPFVIAGLSDFLVYNPTSDPCTMGGETKMYTLFYQTGTAFLQPIYLAPGAVSGGKIQRAMSLGPGAPPPGEGVAAAITKEGNIEKFVQVSTGVVIQGLQQPPYNIKSRIVHWMEK